MDMCEDCFFTLGRRLLKAIDVVAQQGGVHTKRASKFCYVDFFVGKEETL